MKRALLVTTSSTLIVMQLLFCFCEWMGFGRVLLSNNFVNNWSSGCPMFRKDSCEGHGYHFICCFCAEDFWHSVLLWWQRLFKVSETAYLVYLLIETFTNYLKMFYIVFHNYYEGSNIPVWLAQWPTSCFCCPTLSYHGTCDVLAMGPNLKILSLHDCKAYWSYIVT